jgi:hypothetical protein
MEENKIGLEIKTDPRDYPHMHLVEDENAPGTSRELNLSQLKVLIEFKQICLKENIIPNFDYFDDYYLLKFCRARDFIIEDIVKMFKNFIEWRQKNGVDYICENFQFKEFDEVLKIYPHGFHKVDREGRPIYYQILSKLDATKLFAITTSEKLIKYFTQTYELLMKYKFKACSKAKGHIIEQLCIILDIENIGITDLFGKTRTFLTLSTKIGQDYYPSNMAKMFLINASKFFYLVYNLVKPFIAEGSRRKIEFLGKDYKERVFEFIDPDNLPTFLGGNCKCEHIPGGCLYADIGPWNPQGKRYNYTGEGDNS